MMDFCVKNKLGTLIGCSEAINNKKLVKEHVTNFADILGPIGAEKEKMIKELPGKVSAMMEKLSFAEKTERSDQTYLFCKLYHAIVDVINSKKEWRFQLTNPNHFPKDKYVLACTQAADEHKKNLTEYGKLRLDVDALKKTDAFQKLPDVQEAQKLLKFAQENGVDSKDLGILKTLVVPDFIDEKALGVYELLFYGSNGITLWNNKA